MIREKIRRLLIIISQALIIVIAFNATVLFRHDGVFPSSYLSSFMFLMFPLILIKMPSLCFMQYIFNWWRYVSIYDLISLAKANIIASLMFAAYIKIFPISAYHVSISLLVLDFLLCFLFMSAARVSVRIFREYFAKASKAKVNRSENVLIAGLNYRFFAGVPCKELKPLYESMSTKFMHYIPAVK